MPFNDDILDNTNSIRIDVNNIDQIISAINRLKNDAVLLQRLHQGAKRSAKRLDINLRAENILRFMELSK